jgi:hypothetical protein
MGPGDLMVLMALLGEGDMSSESQVTTPKQQRSQRKNSKLRAKIICRSTLVGTNKPVKTPRLFLLNFTSSSLFVAW